MRSLCYCSLILLLGISAAAPTFGADGVRSRPTEDEVVYFLLPDRFENGDKANDRGGLKGDRMQTGFDPASNGFYHGGDLAGVTSRLDYIQSLGATAVWLAPVFKNKPVQGAAGEESAGYHGYWVTDFTRVDPHFGDERTFAAFVEAAHLRGLKVYLDIITNHTADVIAYRECPQGKCPYRSRADYPRKAYTPFVPKGEENVKVPAWLNDPRYYHNRGDATFRGENSELGDFIGLDDLATEDPRVVQGFIEIYGDWIERFGIDGYRIDTARHVNAEFWQAFIPAMLSKASAKGIPSFYVFGEIAAEGIDVAQLARFTNGAKFPAVLDFAFANAVRMTVAGDAPTYVLARVFADDVVYAGGEKTARQLPTFISNHDMGRFAWFVRNDRPQASDTEVAKRVMLAHAMLMTLRGVPVIYYGDEQGFAGKGGDKEARQDMFGIAAKTPLSSMIAELAALRAANPAFRGGRQIVRNSVETPGLFAASRLDEVSGTEILVAFNTSTAPIKAFAEVGKAIRRFEALHGSCAPGPTEPGVLAVQIGPLDYIICKGAH